MYGRHSSVAFVNTPTADLLWGTRHSPSRGPKPAMSVERITDAAIAIADAEGIAAVSMQRIAADLGFTKMALYRYVPGKAELVALMIDTAVGEPPVLDPSGGWRTGLTEWAAHLLHGSQRHPWLLGVTVGPRILGPCEVGWIENALVALDGTGLDGGERIDAVAVVAGHIRAIAQQSAGTDHPDAELSGPLAELMRDHGDRYPALTAALTESVEHGGQDNALDFGLHRILDGLGLLIAARTRGRRAQR